LFNIKILGILITDGKKQVLMYPNQGGLHETDSFDRFASLTTIKYSIPKMSAPQKVSIKIFDARGRLIRTLLNDVTMGGNFLIRWDAKNDKGCEIPAGMYFAVLEISTGIHSILFMKVIR